MAHNSMVDTFLSTNSNQRSALLHQWTFTSNENDVLRALQKLKTTDTYTLSSNINLEDTNGNTLLLNALINKKFRLSKWLLENFDDINVDVQNCTSLDSAAILACKNKQTDILNLLIRKNANLELTNKEGKTAFICAVQQDSLEIVKLLINKKVNIDHQDEHGRTALMKSSVHTSTDVVALLISAKAKINILDNEGKHALIHAAEKGKLGIIDLLIQKDVETNHQDKYGRTALMYGARKGSRIVKSLIGKGATVDMQDNEGKHALIHAAEKGKFEVVKSLINNKANIGHQDVYGRTALMYAAKQGEYEIVDLLISRGASIDIRDYEGKTARMHASSNHKLKIVELLDNRKEIIESPDYQFNKDLHHACARNDIKAVRGLIKNRNDDKKVKKALSYCYRSNNIKMMDLLIKEFNIDLKIQDENGNNAVMLAIKQGANRSTVTSLIKCYHVDYTQENNEGDDALIYACKLGKTLIVKLLLQNFKPDINKRNNKGKTALMYTCEKGKLEIIKYLFECKKLDPNIQDNDQKNALNYAMEHYASHDITQSPRKAKILTILFEKAEYISTIKNNYSTIIQLVKKFPTRATTDLIKMILNKFPEKITFYELEELSDAYKKNRSPIMSVLSDAKKKCKYSDFHTLKIMDTRKEFLVIPNVKSYAWMDNLDEENNISIHKKRERISDGYFSDQKKHKTTIISDSNKRIDFKKTRCLDSNKKTEKSVHNNVQDVVECKDIHKAFDILNLICHDNNLDKQCTDFKKPRCLNLNTKIKNPEYNNVSEVVEYSSIGDTSSVSDSID